MPDRGTSAMPAVENAAIPQYRAFPYEVIVVPSVARSAKYKPDEKINHSMVNKKIIFRKGV
jgi:hypothetical protein